MMCHVHGWAPREDNDGKLSASSRRIKRCFAPSILELTRAGERVLNISEPGVLTAQEKFLACMTEQKGVDFVRTLCKLVIANGDHARVPYDLPPVATRGIKRNR